jgi:hypothetical protein
MNPNNYTSLEVSRKLVEAEIVLETEFWWVHHDPCSRDDMAVGCYGEWELEDCTGGSSEYVPAPSMSELWRELPGRLSDTRLSAMRMSKGTTVIGYISPKDMCWVCKFDEGNPCDALAELLIWVRKELKDDKY